MSIMATGGGGSFKQADVGTVGARCYMILDLGTQRSEYKGEVFVKHQVLVSWEVPSQLMEDGRPIAISKFYTLSLHEKSNLGIDLTSWRGKAFTEEEKQGFDISKLLGVPCMLSIVDKEGKAKVSTVMGLPKGMEAPVAINDPILFDLQDYINGNTEVFDNLSEGLQGIIKKAQELNVSHETENPAPKDFNDDIPF